MIRVATKNDIDAIERGYIELLNYEKEMGGYSNWVMGVYPTRATAEKAFNEDTLYVLEENGEICASVILNQNQPEDYVKINWKFQVNNNEVLVVHTLCVPPSKSGKGYGKAMVKFAMEKAKNMGFRVIRLDTFTNNEPAKKLYTGLGCIISGELEVLHEGVIREKLVYLEMNLMS